MALPQTQAKRDKVIGVMVVRMEWYEVYHAKSHLFRPQPEANSALIQHVRLEAPITTWRCGLVDSDGLVLRHMACMPLAWQFTSQWTVLS